MMSPAVMKMLADAHLADINRQVERERMGDRRDREESRLSMPLALGAVFLAALLGSGLVL